ncbi:hypothetical protein D3C86_1501200 [compost metagenome]
MPERREGLVPSVDRVMVEHCRQHRPGTGNVEQLARLEYPGTEHGRGNITASSENRRAGQQPAGACSTRRDRAYSIRGLDQIGQQVGIKLELSNQRGVPAHRPTVGKTVEAQVGVVHECIVAVQLRHAPGHVRRRHDDLSDLAIGFGPVLAPVQPFRRVIGTDRPTREFKDLLLAGLEPGYLAGATHIQPGVVGRGRPPIRANGGYPRHLSANRDSANVRQVDSAMAEHILDRQHHRCIHLLGVLLEHLA